jgi:glycosyltransferase involved in cell wall biosynthesis
MPKVSVIVPLYNGERFIRSAIDSVFCQTLQDLELIVVDDGSTDRGKEIVSEVQGTVRYVYQKNAGTAAARNQGFLQSRGEYVAFLDQDDRWYPQKLETQVRQLDENPHIAAVYSDIDVIDEADCVIQRGYLSSWSDSVEARGFLGIFSEYPRPDAYPSATLIRREIFLRAGMFDPAFKKNCFEDVDLWFRVVIVAQGKFHFHAEPLVQIRRHAQQGGRNQESWQRNLELCAEKLLEMYRDDPRVSLLRWKLARIFSHKGKYLIRAGDVILGRMYLKKAFGYYPFYWKNLRRLGLSYFRFEKLSTRISSEE